MGMITITDPDRIVGRFVRLDGDVHAITGAKVGPQSEDDETDPGWQDNPTVLLTFPDRKPFLTTLGANIETADVNEVTQKMVATDRILGRTIGVTVGLVADAVILHSGLLNSPRLYALTDDASKFIALIGVPVILFMILGELSKTIPFTRYLRPALTRFAADHIQKVRAENTWHADTGTVWPSESTPWPVAETDTTTDRQLP